MRPIAARILALAACVLALCVSAGCSDFRDGPLVALRVDAGAPDMVVAVDHPPVSDGPLPDARSCGDGMCSPDENCSLCPSDCGRCPFGCGNNICDGAEDCVTCMADCGACLATCGNGMCMGQETCRNCPRDCGQCPPVCGDGTCRGTENCAVCPMDCGMCPLRCGDGICSAPGETCSNCASDCGMCPARCGDGMCNGAESCRTCPEDCRRCTCAMGCARNYLCSELGACELVPLSRWVVSITTGMIAARRPDGSPWNSLTGEPNPYACLSFGAMRFCTDPSLQTRRPTWNFALPAMTAQTLLMGARAELIDRELFNENAICAPGNVTINADSFAAGAVTVACTTGQFTFTLSPI